MATKKISFIAGLIIPPRSRSVYSKILYNDTKSFIRKGLLAGAYRYSGYHAFFKNDSDILPLNQRLSRVREHNS